MRRQIEPLILAFVLAFAMVYVSAEAQQLLQTVQPIISSDGTSDIATEVTALAIASAVERTADAVEADIPTRVYNEATTTGGWLPFSANGSDGSTPCTSTAQAVKASPGNVGGWIVSNPNTADSWVQVYNLAAGSVTVGTTPPALSIPFPGIAANSTAAHVEMTIGISLSAAISIACTSTIGGNGAPANALNAILLYK